MYRINYFSSFKNIHQIWQHEDGNYLYLGDYSAAMDVNMLKNKNIQTVVTAAAGLPLDYSKAAINHIVYMALDMPSYNIAKHFSDAIQKIEKGLKEANVFVHCAAGISRSTSIVCAYLMQKNKWTFTKTLSFVRSKRRIVCPNPGFQRQLRNYQKQLQKQTDLSSSNAVMGQSFKAVKREDMTKTMSVAKKQPQQQELPKTQVKRMSLQPGRRTMENTNFNMRMLNPRR